MTQWARYATQEPGLSLNKKKHFSEKGQYLFMGKPISQMC